MNDLAVINDFLSGKTEGKVSVSLDTKTIAMLAVALFVFLVLGIVVGRLIAKNLNA